MNLVWLKALNQVIKLWLAEDSDLHDQVEVAGPPLDSTHVRLASQNPSKCHSCRGLAPEHEVCDSNPHRARLLDAHRGTRETWQPRQQPAPDSGLRHPTLQISAYSLGKFALRTRSSKRRQGKEFEPGQLSFGGTSSLSLWLSGHFLIIS
jgi:hypothetical protein